MSWVNVYLLTQGWEVPDPGDPQRWPDGQGQRPQGHHQVPDEEGTVIKHFKSFFETCNLYKCFLVQYINT